MRNWLCDHADGVYLTVLVTVIVVVIVVAASGCADKPQPLSGVGQGIAAAEAYRDTAYRHAGNRDVVRTALGEDGQKRSLAEASKALTEAEKQYAAEHDARLRAEADLRQERDQWLGDRGKRYVWTIVGSIVAVWLGLGLLGTFLSVTTGGASVWAGKLFMLLPLGSIFRSLAARKAGS